ncbi:MAG: ABC transporter permease [Phototrophicaceae bacterium]
MPVVFLLLFFVYPLVTILWVSFQWVGGGVREVLADATTWYVVGFTLRLAVVSVVATLLPSLFASFVFARYQFWGREFFLALSLLPFVLPISVTANAFTALLGEQGIITVWLQHTLGTEIHLAQSFSMLILVHVFYNYPLASRMLTIYWRENGLALETVARVYGASAWVLWWRVRLPILFPMLASVSLLVFAFSFTSFGTVLLLGGNRHVTLEVEIYRQAVGFLNFQGAAWLSCLQLVLMGTVFTVYGTLQRSWLTATRIRPQPLRPSVTLTDKLWLGGQAILFVVCLLPLVALVWSSLYTGGEWSWAGYRGLLLLERRSVLTEPPIWAMVHSVRFAMLTMIGALLLGGVLAYELRRMRSRWAGWLDWLFMLPLATSTVTLGFGFIVALDEPPLNLRTSFWMIPIAHTLVALPMVIRTLLTSWRSIPDALYEACRLADTSPLKTFLQVEFPLLRGAFITAGMVAFATSLGEFGATLFIARSDFQTVPLVIYRLLGQPGSNNYSQAMALSVLLLMLTAFGWLGIRFLAYQDKR